jgi:hypothetical protein
VDFDSCQVAFRSVTASKSGRAPTFTLDPFTTGFEERHGAGRDSAAL